MYFEFLRVFVKCLQLPPVTTVAVIVLARCHRTRGRALGVIDRSDDLCHR